MPGQCSQPHSPACYRHIRRRVRPALRGHKPLLPGFKAGTFLPAVSGRSWVLRHNDLLSETQPNKRPSPRCIQPLSHRSSAESCMSSGYPLLEHLPCSGPCSLSLWAELDESHAQRQSPSDLPLGFGVSAPINTLGQAGTLQHAGWPASFRSVPSFPSTLQELRT